MTLLVTSKSTNFTTLNTVY